MSEFDQILIKLGEQHDDIRSLGDVARGNAVAIASQGEALEEIKYSLREEKSNRIANCLLHDKRLSEVEGMHRTLAVAYNTLVKFGAGFIAVGTFILTFWFVIEKIWKKWGVFLKEYL